MALKWVSAVSDNAVNVIRGPGVDYGALNDAAVTTTSTNFNLTAWEGQLVAVTITADAYYRWTDTSGDTFTTGTEQLVASDANTAPNRAIVGRLPQGRHTLTVPTRSGSASVFLMVAAVSGTVDVRVERV